MLEKDKTLLETSNSDPLNGNTPLHVACQSRQLEMVKTLIQDHKQSIVALNNKKQTCLHSALVNCDIDISHPEVNPVPIVNNNALLMTSLLNQLGGAALAGGTFPALNPAVNLAEVLLIAQQQQQQLQEAKPNPMEDLLKLVDYLLQNKVDASVADNLVNTALHDAVER